MKNLIVLLLTVSLFLVSCSNELTREQAKDLLIERVGYPYVEFGMTKWNIQTFAEDGKGMVTDTKKYGKTNISDLEDLGLMNISQGTKRVGMGYRIRSVSAFNYSLSKKAKEDLWDDNSLNRVYSYWQATLPLFQIGIGDISGVKFENEDKTKATIEFTELLEKTSPYYMISTRGVERETAVNRTATAELYDDGWRITSIDLPKNIEKKKVSEITNWSELVRGK